MVCFVYIDLLWLLAFTEFWSRNRSVKVYISNQMFCARVLCSRFRLKNWIVHLFSSFGSRAVILSNYTSPDRRNCGRKKYFPRNAHVEIQIKDLLLSVEFFTSFSLRPSRQSTHATAIVAENISDLTSHAGKPKNIYISMFWCFRKLPSETDVLVGEFWDSFTYHNSENYSGQGINMLTNQRLSRHSGETRKRLTSAIHRRLSPRFFFRPEGASVHSAKTICF